MVAPTQQSGEPAKRGEMGVDLPMATQGERGTQGQTGLPSQLGSGCPWVPPPTSSSDGSVSFPPQALLQARRTLLLATALATAVAAGAAGVRSWVGEENGHHGAGDWP